MLRSAPNITLLCAASLLGCGAPAAPAVESAPSTTGEVAPSTSAVPSVAPAAPADPVAAAAPEHPPSVHGPRLVGIGDLHADLPTALKVLQLAELVDAEGRWSGGDAVLVQTGDQTDRGPDSLEVIELLMRLQAEAEASGGRVQPLLGNHEVMNLMGDLRYVSPEDVQDFGSAAKRAEAFSAQGELGKWLRSLPMVAVEQGVVFVHGGVTEQYAKMGLKQLNGLAPGVLAGTLPPTALGDSSPIWFRGYLRDPEVQACAELDGALKALAARRMVVGHTTQRDGQIASRCGGRLLGIDTGISSHYGGHSAALEISNGDARALYPQGAVDLPDP